MANIFVARLDFSVTQEDLKRTFEQHGKVVKVSLATDKETGKSKGFAFIEMGSKEEANQAIEALDGATLNGRQIAVKEGENRDKDSRPARPFQNNQNDRRPPREQNNSGNSEYKKPVSDFKAPSVEPNTFVPFNADSGFGKDNRKKEKDVKKKEGKPKTHKMEAYKKSGKQNRFFDFDDEDDY